MVEKQLKGKLDRAAALTGHATPVDSINIMAGNRPRPNVRDSSVSMILLLYWHNLNNFIFSSIYKFLLPYEQTGLDNLLCVAHNGK